jgi:uncharacterized protein YbjT (DUF2867 family)
MILVTGASGNAGGTVLGEVLKTGKPVKAMYRSPDDAAKSPGNTQAVIADFGDRPSLARALKGVDTVYLVCSPVRELVELEGNMLDACREGGVRHVVLNSALGAEDYAKSFPSWHRRVEDKLKTSGLEYTILRPNSFMQNIPGVLRVQHQRPGSVLWRYGRRPNQLHRHPRHRRGGGPGADLFDPYR